MAPRARPAPMAASPATPAPMIMIFAGGIFPAAVIWPVNGRLNAAAASTTARYPARLAMELKTSIFCARVVRGIASKASVETFAPASCFRSSGFWAGMTKLTKKAPAFSMAISPGDGARTFKTTSADDSKAFASGTIRAPALTYSASSKPAASPASLCTATSKPSFLNFSTLPGVIATRRSPGKTSRGIPNRKFVGGLIVFSPGFLPGLSPAGAPTVSCMTSSPKKVGINNGFSH